MYHWCPQASPSTCFTSVQVCSASTPEHYIMSFHFQVHTINRINIGSYSYIQVEVKLISTFTWNTPRSQAVAEVPSWAWTDSELGIIKILCQRHFPKYFMWHGSGHFYIDPKEWNSQPYPFEGIIECFCGWPTSIFAKEHSFYITGDDIGLSSFFPNLPREGLLSTDGLGGS